jgi:hypothetical protein
LTATAIGQKAYDFRLMQAASRTALAYSSRSIVAALSIASARLPGAPCGARSGRRCRVRTVSEPAMGTADTREAEGIGMLDTQVARPVSRGTDKRKPVCAIVQSCGLPGTRSGSSRG